jgi:hypothetical protein
MYEMFNGAVPMHAVAMCILMNIALVLSIAALIKYLIKGKCGCGCNCGCSCCNGKKSNCDLDNKGCDK